jgi:hypothetical protein
MQCVVTPPVRMQLVDVDVMNHLWKWKMKVLKSIALVSVKRTELWMDSIW